MGPGGLSGRSAEELLLREPLLLRFAAPSFLRLLRFSFFGDPVAPRLRVTGVAAESAAALDPVGDVAKDTTDSSPQAGLLQPVGADAEGDKAEEPGMPRSARSGRAAVEPGAAGTGGNQAAISGPWSVTAWAPYGNADAEGRGGDFGVGGSGESSSCMPLPRNSSNTSMLFPAMLLLAPLPSPVKASLRWFSRPSTRARGGGGLSSLLAACPDRLHPEMTIAVSGLSTESMRR